MASTSDSDTSKCKKKLSTSKSFKCLKQKYKIYIFLFLVFFKWVYDFFGGTEALDLINKKNQVIFIGISTHTYSIF